MFCFVHQLFLGLTITMTTDEGDTSLVTIVVAFGFLPKQFERCMDLWMVLCPSMKSGLVVGAVKPYLRKRICLNFLHSQAAGTQKLQAWVLAPEPLGETFTIFFFSKCKFQNAGNLTAAHTSGVLVIITLRLRTRHFLDASPPLFLPFAFLPASNFFTLKIWRKQAS